MKKKQQTNLVLGWINGKVSAIKVNLKALEGSRLPHKMKKQKNTDWDGSFYMLTNQSKFLRSLQ